MRELDPLSIALEGTHLVEAAAGTGKTHGLTALFVRLVSEGGLAPEQIAVVTFTEAATRELRTRVRERLLSLAQRLSGATALRADAQLDALAVRLRDDPRARDRIETALLTLDEATIATIHGFCRRVLMDFALETGVSFAEIEPDAGLVARDRALRDFWRLAVIGAPDDAEWVASWCESPRELGRWLDAALRVPPENVEPASDPDAAEHLAEALELKRREGALLFAQIEAELDGIAAAGKAFSQAQKSAYLPDTLAERRRTLRSWLQGRARAAPLRGIELLTRSCLAKHRLKGGTWSQRDASVCAWADDTLAVAVDDAYARRTAFLQRALSHVRSAMAAHQREQRVSSFDALIADLRRLLHGPQGARIRAAVQARYRVAMVDEFQDTDAEQYAIFRALFHGREGAGLYLIGDPKQAIYRFRGGDVFAYRDAARDAGENRWSLTANWRSDPRVLDALNALFDPSRAPGAFVYDFIEYRAVHAGQPRPERVRALPAADQPVLALHFANAQPKQLMAREPIARRVLRAMAEEIARLLRGNARGSLPRIAVLVRDRYQLDDVVRELARWQLPVSHATPESVFQSAEAYELLVVLEALADPRDMRKARAALATELLDGSASRLRALAQDAHAWDAAIATLAQLGQTLREAGAAALARALAQRAGPRWLASAGGRRRLTNLAQLGELMQQARVEGPSAQVAWLERRMAETTPDFDSELRPDAGDAPVEVTTVHKAKGLEWDVVFLPFLWAGKDSSIASDPLAIDKRKPVSYHAADGTVRVDLGSGDWLAHAQDAAREEDAESVRLAYVALTRARQRIVLAWGRGWGAQRSPLAGLLHRADGAGATEFPGLASMADSLVEQRLLDWSAAADDAVAVAPVPDVEAIEPLASAWQPDQLAPRTFAGTIEREYAVLSFSSLFGEGNDEMRDRDQSAPPLQPAEPGPVPSQPRGPEFGEAVHSILERMDLARLDAADNIALIESACRAAGYDEDAEEVVRELVAETLRAHVLPGISIAQLAPHGARPEVEFFFPLTQARLPAIAAALALEPRYARSADELAGLRSRWHGLMHGYVDLVFGHDGRYGLLDYKTNFLGTQYEDYAHDALARTVRDTDYDLQYLIYSVALVRHLRARLGAAFDYETHFAGVTYLFLRGLAGGQGVFRDVPRREVIDALDEAFGLQAPAP